MFLHVNLTSNFGVDIYNF